LQSERELYVPALAYVHGRRWAGIGAVVAEEVPVSGRRVDCGVLTRSGRLLAFEFKLRNTTKALWQASLNSYFFDRSFVVINTRVTPATMEKASAFGVEILSIIDNECIHVGRSRPGGPQRVVRRRVKTKVLERGHDWGDYVQGF
jgi:hypothetical protein